MTYEPLDYSRWDGLEEEGEGQDEKSAGITILGRLPDAISPERLRALPQGAKDVCK